MNDPALLGREHRCHHGHGWFWLLAVIFTVAAVGSLVLVVVDLLIGRAAEGDLFIAFLNALAAVVLWREVSNQART
ncbi:hypothetical protein MOD31_11040 [Paenarthrobacter sp. TYUT067]|uniref:hypothetical protein n=1 Tax=Paenarthrobacter sp. TYUT067 TaxID=2926245 RepID=UPI0020304133|nr:hypothetical protein [Paenarthrobacter sp. TYUT067]MCM0616560.1 hypothetical protein [Paenarthrobacter sp. TYUT067]